MDVKHPIFADEYPGRQFGTGVFFVRREDPVRERLTVCGARPELRPAGQRHALYGTDGFATAWV